MTTNKDINKCTLTNEDIIKSVQKQMNKSILTSAIKAGSSMRRMGIPGGKAVISGASRLRNMTPVGRAVLGVGTAGTVGTTATIAAKKKKNNSTTNKAQSIDDINKGILDMARRVGSRGLKGLKAGARGINRAANVVDAAYARHVVDPIANRVAPVATRGVERMGRAVRDIGYRGQGRLMNRRGLTGLNDPAMRRMGTVSDLGRGIQRHAPSAGRHVGRLAGDVPLFAVGVGAGAGARALMRRKPQQTNKAVTIDDINKGLASMLRGAAGKASGYAGKYAGKAKGVANTVASRTKTYAGKGARYVGQNKAAIIPAGIGTAA
jgi:hypothetical protein